MKKQNLIILGIIALIVAVNFSYLTEAECFIPIEHRIVIDNIKDFSNYVFIAHLSDGNTRSPNFDYIIFDSPEVPFKKNDKILSLKEIYVVKKSDFENIEKVTIVTKRDTCGNIIIDNVPNNTCNTSSYSIEGASYSYPYNYELDSKFVALNISQKNVGGKECGDDKMPDAREDHFIIINESGKLKVELEKAVYYYQNNIIKTAFPDKEGKVEIITLTDNEIQLEPGFFQKIINWFKSLF